MLQWGSKTPVPEGKRGSVQEFFTFDEHTWGASQSVKEPDSPETYSQLVHKVEMAYKAADLAGYALSHQMENYVTIRIRAMDWKALWWSMLPIAYRLRK